MKDNVFGIDCDIDVTGGSLMAEDGSIIIFNTNEGEQLFIFTDLSIKNCGGFFEKYFCSSLMITRREVNEEVDLDDIKFQDRLKKLTLELITPTKFAFIEGKKYFQNLGELNISGNLPDNFPNLMTMPKLKTLTIDFKNYSENEWLCLENIADLNILDYKFNDLFHLKNIPNLKRLRLTNGKMKSLDGLESMPQLETLFIAANASKLTDVNAIIRSKNLKNIMFESLRKIQKWDFLKSKNDLQCICLDTAESVDFMKDFPNLEFFFCKKVLDKKSKSFLFSTTLHQDTMTKDGIQVSYIVPCNKFYDALD